MLKLLSPKISTQFGMDFRYLHASHLLDYLKKGNSKIGEP